MKRFASGWLVLGILMVAAGGAVAEPLDPDDDGIGVYFDPCACVNCLSMPVGDHTGYIVITHPTSPQGVGGWEARITHDGPFVISNWDIVGNGMNFGNTTDFWVTVGTPLINPFTYPAVIVAIFDFTIISDASEILFWVDGIYNHSLPDQVPAYLDGADYNIIKPLQQPSGSPDLPVANINGDCNIVADEGMSWGAVKSLYR